MKPGEVSEPIRAQSGWHLIKVKAREPGTPQTFEDALPAIREHLRVADFEAMLHEVLREKGLKVYGG
jgi:parvulin-like peptidyl-prolyl isomerase